MADIAASKVAAERREGSNPSQGTRLARMAELVDATGLKPVEPEGSCGFDSHFSHQI